MKNIKYIISGLFLFSTAIFAQTNEENVEGECSRCEHNTTKVAAYTYAIDYQPTTVTNVNVMKVIDLTEKSVFFETGKSEIRDSSKNDLHKVADALKNTSGFDIIIEGHAESNESETYNYKLARKRAENIYEFLVAHGVEKDRLSVKSYNKNDTFTGKYKYTRKVEFHFSERS